MHCVGRGWGGAFLLHKAFWGRRERKEQEFMLLWSSEKATQQQEQTHLESGLYSFGTDLASAQPVQGSVTAGAARCS